MKPPGANRTSFTSKSCTSMLDNTTNSEFTTGFSARNSIIDGHNGDTNNNFHIGGNCTMDGDDSGSERGRKFSLKKFFKRKIASTKFKNIQIEMLYQRYLLRMNQNNAAHIVWLLFALIFILAIIHINFLLSRWNDELKCSSNSTANTNFTIDQDANFTTLFENEINLTMSTNQSTMEQPEAACVEPINTYELLGTNFIQFSLLGLCSVLYTILLLCLYKQRINEIYLFHVSYAIIISLVIIDISFSITNMGK
jgi:disulfide bond formation protein DsbB